MKRSFFVILFLAATVLGSGGCVAMLAGAGGTVVWQGGKVISEEKVSMERAANAVRQVLRAHKIRLVDEVVKRRATQIRGEDPAGVNINVDVVSTGPNSSRLEIRAGLGDKSLARQLLNDIKSRL